MDGAVQTVYPRKNWSSMVLYNCGHPKNKVLTPEVVSTQTGAFLHRFQWLEDEEIGSIPFVWNFLEDYAAMCVFLGSRAGAFALSVLSATRPAALLCITI
ncbi:hypothetical protein OIU78_022500 [Salix suchowensis]|nr:hypothetical protein OIU78_022500 [Salix suchowensis]